MTIATLLLVIALVFFLLAAFNLPTKVSWLALGLACCVLATLLGGGRIAVLG